MSGVAQAAEGNELLSGTGQHTCVGTHGCPEEAELRENVFYTLEIKMCLENLRKVSNRIFIHTQHAGFLLSRKEGSVKMH